MGQTIGAFIFGVLGYGFVYAIVYLVAIIGLDMKDVSVRANLAGQCAIATSILVLGVIYALGADNRQDREDARHNNAQDREDARRKAEKA